MDFFAHGLWTGALYSFITYGATLKGRAIRHLKVRYAVFWGVFPDLFAFTPLFSVLIANTLLGRGASLFMQHAANAEPVPFDAMPLARLTSHLYSFSHSVIVFAFVFLIAYCAFRRPVWELTGWLLHILIDIPSHSYRFYPTPFLWPLSSFKVDGHSWADPSFMAVNYGLLALAYAGLLILKAVVRRRYVSPNKNRL